MFAILALREVIIVNPASFFGPQAAFGKFFQGFFISAFMDIEFFNSSFNIDLIKRHLIFL